jgi:hypothetical protein
MEDQQWWNNLFNAFGVSDDTIKGNIMNQVRQDTDPGTAPPTGLGGAQTDQDPLDDSPDPQPAQSPQTGPVGSGVGSAGAGTVPGAGEAQGTDRDSLLAALKSERDAEMANQDDILGQLSSIRKQREQNREEIGHLRNRLDQARAAGPQPEPEPEQPRTSNIIDPNTGEPYVYPEWVCKEVALSLLEESTVQRNLNVVCKYMLRNLAARTNNRNVKIPTLTEAGLRDRLRGAFQNVRNFAANPEYTKRKLGGATGKAKNQRAAKLAVQALTDHLRTDFEAKLTENGMTPDQIKQKMETWASLKAMYDRGNPDPKLIDAFIAASNEMKKIFELFRSGGGPSPFDAPEQPQPAQETGVIPSDKREFLKSAFAAMHKASMDAGRAAAGQDPQTIYDIIKGAAAKAAKTFAENDPESTRMVWKYFMSKLDEAYGNQYYAESTFDNIERVLTEAAGIFSRYR